MEDVGAIVGSTMDASLGKMDSTTEMSDEDFTKAKIHLSNLRCEVRSLAEQREELEEAEKDSRDKVRAAMGELTSCRTKIAQYEVQNKILQETLQDLELKRSHLESAMSGLQEQLGAHESKIMMTGEETEEEEGQFNLAHSAADTAEEVEKAELREELDRLKREILDKEMEIRNVNQQQETQQATMAEVVKELEEMQLQYGEEKEQLVQAKREALAQQRLQHDIGGLTETVSREMDRINELRDLYTRHVTSRLKSKSVDEVLFYSRPQECEFLEKNLEELEREHKKAVSEHSDMGREIPRLRSIVSNKSKRIGQLEHMIEETRDKANVDCEKLRLDLEQTRNSHQAKLKEGQLRPSFRRASTGITYTDQLTGLSHTHSIRPGGFKSVTDPLTGLVQSGPRDPPVVDEVTGLMIHEGRLSRRPGPTFVRPVIRRNSSEWSCRDRLVAGAGVALIGQRTKLPHFTNTKNKVPATSKPEGVAGGTEPKSLRQRSSLSNSMSTNSNNNSNCGDDEGGDDISDDQATAASGGLWSSKCAFSLLTVLVLLLAIAIAATLSFN